MCQREENIRDAGGNDVMKGGKTLASNTGSVLLAL